MTHKEFRINVQSVLDRNGIFTRIERQSSKSFAVIIGYEIVAVYKQRVSCKNFIIRFYKDILNKNELT